LQKQSGGSISVWAVYQAAPKALLL
jgi:hypothetical protein